MRASFYIDGFNVYGAICDLIKSDQKKGLRPPHDLKWISYRSLCSWLLTVPQQIAHLNGFGGVTQPQTLQSINFYTALPVIDWSLPGAVAMQNVVARHQTFIQACEAEGVRVHLGKFKRRDQYCKTCGTSNPKYEEKETDVHIATDLVCHALQGQMDIAYVLTGDSDIAPAFECIKAHSQVKLVSVAFQPRAHSSELLAWADGHMYVRRHSLTKNYLPALIPDPKTGVPIQRPSRYKP